MMTMREKFFDFFQDFRFEDNILSQGRFLEMPVDATIPRGWSEFNAMVMTSCNIFYFNYL